MKEKIKGCSFNDRRPDRRTGARPARGEAANVRVNRRLKAAAACFLLALLVWGLLPGPGLGRRLAAKEAFTVESYHVAIKVGADNAYDITEKLQVRFTEARHGIIRSLPLFTYAGKRAEISQISAEGPFSVRESKDYLQIRLGSEDKLEQGEVLYTIKYRYDIGEDNLPDMDEFYFNIIGTEWDTSIDQVSFTVEMPADFSAERLNFTRGPLGSVQKADLDLTLDGRTISGRLLSPLAPHEGLTMALPLPQGYYTGRLRGGLSGRQQSELFICAAVFVLGTAALIFFRLKNRRPAALELRPPEDVNPADLFYFYTGQVNDRALTALLLDWARRGLIQLEPCRRSRLSGKKSKMQEDMIIRLPAEAPQPAALKPYERKLYAYFQKKAKGSGSFYLRSLAQAKEFAKIRTEVQNALPAYWSEAEHRIFAPRSKIYKAVLMILGLLPCLIYWFGRYERQAYEPHISLLAAVVMSLLFYMIGVYYPGLVLRDPARGTKEWRRDLLKAAGFFLLGAAGMLGYTHMLTEQWEIAPGLAAYLAMAASTLAAMNARIYTPYGLRQMQRADGFRQFLLHTEKNTGLRQAGTETGVSAEELTSPSAFFSGLAFAYVLGLASRWAEQFKDFGRSGEDTFEGIKGYQSFGSPLLFVNSFEKNLKAAEQSLRPVSDSSGSGSGSGGSSGGGSSGGGSGGGGGSSW